MSRRDTIIWLNWVWRCIWVKIGYFLKINVPRKQTVASALTKGFPGGGSWLGGLHTSHTRFTLPPRLMRSFLYKWLFSLGRPHPSPRVNIFVTVYLLAGRHLPPPGKARYTLLSVCSLLLLFVNKRHSQTNRCERTYEASTWRGRWLGAGKLTVKTKLWRRDGRRDPLSAFVRVISFDY